MIMNHDLKLCKQYQYTDFNEADVRYSRPVNYDNEMIKLNRIIEVSLIINDHN